MKTVVADHPEGTIVSVRAQAGAKRNEVRGPNNGTLRLGVTQAPEKGKANKALMELLAKALGVRKSQVELISGETSPQKRFLIRGLTALETAERLEAGRGGIGE